MTTENTIEYLDDIIPQNRKSLEINSNKGPSFEDFCAKKEINHQLTTAACLLTMEGRKWQYRYTRI